MVCLLNPATWVGLLTLVLLEIVLSIDNLIFIAILIDKLPPNKRDKARFIGLGISLTIRLILLSTISWMTTLTDPIFSNKYFTLSGHDLILLSGGLFLVFKATIELHEKLEVCVNNHPNNQHYSGFLTIIFQIIIVDIIFSLDSIITAVGMVNKLFIMIFAVIIATFIMLIASKSLTKFIHEHQTIVVLCLSFLLIIGVNLVLESFGVYVTKGYMYCAIGFSLLIEKLNQFISKNLIKHESLKPIRQHVTEIIFSIMQKNSNKKINIQSKKIKNTMRHILPLYKNNFQDEEKYMIKNILTLTERSIRSIMTPRKKIIWINTVNHVNNIKIQLLNTPHSIFPLCKDTLDNMIGIIQLKELLIHFDYHKFDIKKFPILKSPIIVLDTVNPIHVIGTLKHTKSNIIIVTNKFGIIQGLITPLDILETITGKFSKINSNK
ncbi:UPF0053 inner membrane protein YoaE [Buchnera aphidicola (Takecallis arundicolens)]|uniref:TerC family protein n=1 Tax=Buchnera aphidicola TaxID=9 RepID=UPI003464CD90